MNDADMTPSIRIHVDQQLTIDEVSGSEEVEDATLATEITGFDVEDDAYVLKGALSFTGFLRREDRSSLPAEQEEGWEAGDVFDAQTEIAEAQVMPLHHRIPFVLQVPMAAQQDYQRQHGILDVNPKIGQWNAHVLGEKTVHLRAELVIAGLSGGEGYVFRCGTQEEGAFAPKLDQLLDHEEPLSFERLQGQPDGEFEPPFDQIWSLEQAARLSADTAIEPEAAEEDDWLIESPAATAKEQEASFARKAEAAGEEEESDIIFTPDPSLVFPMPEPGTEWARRLEERDDSIAHDQSEQEQYGQGQFGQEQFGLVQFGQEQFRQDQFGQEQFGQEQFGQVQHGQGQFGQEQFRQEQFGQGQPRQEQQASAEPDRSNDEQQPSVRFGFDRTSAPHPYAPPSYEFGYGRQTVRPHVVNPSDYTEAEGSADSNAFSNQAPAEQQPSASMTAPRREEAQAQAGGAEADEFAFVVEEARAEERSIAADSGDQQGAESDAVAQESVIAGAHLQAAETLEDRPYEAEYQFEDEVFDPEAAMQGQATEAVESTPPGSPKLSVGAKHGENGADWPVKLSSLLGDSKSREEERESSSSAKIPESSSVQAGSPEASESTSESVAKRESSTHQAVEQSVVNRESSSSHQVEVSSVADRESSSLHGATHSIAESSSVEPEVLEALEIQSDSFADRESSTHPLGITTKSFDDDSFWSEMLVGQPESKVTMKFKVVQVEDSLPDLAERYQTSVSELLRANNLQDHDLDIGQILYIPSTRRS